jgi:hypothetical protein
MGSPHNNICINSSGIEQYFDNRSVLDGLFGQFLNFLCYFLAEIELAAVFTDFGGHIFDYNGGLALLKGYCSGAIFCFALFTDNTLHFLILHFQFPLSPAGQRPLFV